MWNPLEKMLDTVVSRKPAADDRDVRRCGEDDANTPIPNAEAMIKCLRSNRSTSGTDSSEPIG